MKPPIELRILGGLTLGTVGGDCVGFLTSSKRNMRRQLLVLLGTEYPSGLGCSTVRRELWPDDKADQLNWLLDKFRGDICSALGRPKALEVIERKAEQIFLRLGEDLVVDYDDLKTNVEAAEKLERYSRAESDLERAWEHYVAAVGRVPPDTSSLLPALQGLDRQNDYEFQVGVEIERAILGQAELALRLGTVDELGPQLHRLFLDKPDYDRCARLAARVTCVLESPVAALRLIDRHREALRKARLDPTPGLLELESQLGAGDRSSCEPDQPSRSRLSRSAPRQENRGLEGRQRFVVEVRHPTFRSTGTQGRSQVLQEHPLAGTWLHVTFADDDPEMAGPPWSIELAACTRTDGDIYLTRSYRAWPTPLGSSWSGIASEGGGFALGVFRAEGTQGGYGTVRLKHRDDSLVVGSYSYEQVYDRGPHVAFEALPGPWIWARVGSHYADEYMPLVRQTGREELQRFIPPDLLSQLDEYLK